MAITLTDSPEETREGETIRFFSAHNPLLFEFTAGAGETSLQVKVTTPAPADIEEIKTLPFASDGTLLVDVAYIVRSQLSTEDYTDDSRTNTDWELVGDELTESFQLAYRVGGTGSYTQLATTYDGVQAVRQLGSTYGATMAEYLPILSTGPTVDATAKFMTRFEKPVLFYYKEGVNVSVWQLGLTFLMPDDGFTVFDAIEVSWQKNGVEVQGETYQPVTAITSNAVHVPIPEAEGNAANSDTLFLQIGEFVTGGGITNACTENIEIEIREACQNPIALRWQNTLGGFDVWVFEGNTPREFSTSNEGDFGIFPTDIKTATATRGMSKKRAVPSLSLLADSLTLQQAKGLEDLLISPNIQLFTGELTAGNTFDTWQGVTLEAGSFDSYDTFNQRHRLELTILLPDVYTIGA